VTRVRKLGLGSVIVMAACGRQGFGALDASPDGALDAATSSPPMLVASAKARTAGTSTLLFPLTVPPGADRFLIIVGCACHFVAVARVALAS